MRSVSISIRATASVAFTLVVAYTLRNSSQIDTIINLLYVIVFMVGTIGFGFPVPPTREK